MNIASYFGFYLWLSPPGRNADIMIDSPRKPIWEYEVHKPEDWQPEAYEPPCWDAFSDLKASILATEVDDTSAALDLILICVNLSQQLFGELTKRLQMVEGQLQVSDQSELTPGEEDIWSEGFDAGHAEAINLVKAFLNAPTPGIEDEILKDFRNEIVAQVISMLQESVVGATP